MHAGILESANLEHFGLGQGPLRVDLYQSYGWLSPYSYKQNAPYGSKAAEYYLSLDSKKRPDKYADYWDIYRPVYTRKNPNVKDSEIHGQGLFADENISRGEIVVADTSDVKYINHSDSPNLTARYLPDETLEYVAKADIKQGSELTLDYRQLAKLTGHPAANEEVQPETLFNPSEWRHGEFAEEDPFEEYF